MGPLNWLQPVYETVLQYGISKTIYKREAKESLVFFTALICVNKEVLMQHTHIVWTIIRCTSGVSKTEQYQHMHTPSVNRNTYTVLQQT